MKYSTKSVCVVDNGLFIEFAALLAKTFGTTYLYVPWESAFPKSNRLLIGAGLPGVTKIDDLWGHLDDVDLFVFPDVYHGSLQQHLVTMGKRVWGSRMGEELELYRAESKRHLASLGLAVGPYVSLRGMDALREHLKAHEDQYVKISRSRGDMETFHAETYGLIEPRLDELEHALGAKKSLMEFIVEQGIDDAAEIAYDGYTVDGTFPTRAMWGVEIKDKSYIGRVQNYDALPQQIRDVNARLAPTLAKYHYRNFLSVEMRVTKDGTPWIIDPCARAGSPPSELAQLMYTNLPDIFWHGADGTIVDPETVDAWGAELLLLSTWADRQWQAVDFPPALRDHVKLRNLTIIGGRYYVVPQEVGLPEIGAVVATGSTREEAVERVREVADQVRGYYIDVPPIDAAEETFEELSAYGITTTEAAPGPPRGRLETTGLRGASTS